MTKRFIILSGPSCVGKGPLQDAVNKFYPGLLAARPILCHSRKPRKGEVHGKHFYFLPPAYIKSLKNNSDFVVAQVRSDWQAIDLLQVQDLLEGENEIVFVEAFHTFGKHILDQLSSKNFKLISVFLLPEPFGTSDEVIVRTMREKLKRRGTEEEPKLSERAESVPLEIRSARSYTHRILNRAGEDNIEEWGEFGKLNGERGERRIETMDDLGNKARWVLESFVKIINGEILPLEPDKILEFPDKS